MAYKRISPQPITEGGTNASTMATSTGIVKYDGTSLVTSSTAKIDSNNRYTNTSQPCFSAHASIAVNNVTGDGTTYTMIFPTADINQSSSYNTGTGVFTAPIAGNYFFYGSVQLTGIGAQTQAYVQLTATSLTYVSNLIALTASIGGQISLQISAIIPMAASNTCSFAVTASGSTKTVNFAGGNCYFGGYLVC